MAQSGAMSAQEGPAPAILSSSLALFGANRLQELAVFSAEGGACQQVPTVFQGLAQLLFTPPAANFTVVAVKQNLRRAQAAEVRRTRVMRVIEQPPRAVLRAGNAFDISGDL